MSNTILFSSLALILLSLLLAPLGCFLMWKRLSFLADTMSHSSILGIALGMMFDLPVILSSFVYLTVLIVLIKFAINKESLPQDSSLSLISYGCMSIGILILSLSGKNNLITQFLFGDILSIEFYEIILIFIILIISSVFLILFHKQLISILLNKNLAKLSNIPVDLLENIFIFILTLAIGFSLRLGGTLTIPALLIIPAIATKSLSTSYKQMLIFSTLFSIVLSPVAMFFIVQHNTQTGPITVCTYVSGLIILKLFTKIYSKARKIN